MAVALPGRGSVFAMEPSMRGTLLAALLTIAVGSLGGVAAGFSLLAAPAAVGRRPVACWVSEGEGCANAAVGTTPFGVAAPWSAAATAAALAAAASWAAAAARLLPERPRGRGRRRREGSPIARRGLKDRVRKDFTLKSAMVRRLGKWRLQKEFDLRTQIQEDEMLAKRVGVSQDDLISSFDRASDFLKAGLGLEEQSASVAISKVSTGLNMEYLGKPNVPTNEQMATVMDWLEANLKVSRTDGSLKRVVEQYPFVLGRSIEHLEDSKRMCPQDVTFEIAVAEDPALVDKTYNCDGICASQCLACWFNG